MAWLFSFSSTEDVGGWTRDGRRERSERSQKSRRVISMEAVHAVGA